MSERPASRTALDVAVLRAVHQLIDSEPRILDDPVALRLAGPALLGRITSDPARYQTEPARMLRAHVMVRSRYAEDRLAEAARRGVRQMVSLGAGFDTFAYRQPDWARSLRIFEVDQPASQAWKRESLRFAGVEVPDNVEFVAVDFETTSLADGLRGSAFDFTQPAFFSWLGVMVYLTQEASDAVFRSVAALAQGSEIVFTFSQPPEPHDPSTRHAPGFAERVAGIGEPWINFTTPEKLVERLRGFGFSQVTLLTPEETAERYIGGRADGLRPANRTAIASAIV